MCRLQLFSAKQAIESYNDTTELELVAQGTTQMRGSLNMVGAPRVTPVGLHASFAASSSKCA